MVHKRTRNAAMFLMLAVVTVAFGLASSVSLAAQGTASPAADQDAAAKIANAMSAGPPALAENATILDNELDADGNFVVLREGSNGWYCSPDAIGTPGPDPWCYDAIWLDWSYAIANGEEPNTTALGMSYMFQGGSDASNTDPLATEPAAGEDWMTTPPHVMFIVPGELDMTIFTADHLTGGPWVMWAGTPYEHVMMPIVDGEHEM